MIHTDKHMRRYSHHFTSTVLEPDQIDSEGYEYMRTELSKALSRLGDEANTKKLKLSARLNYDGACPLLVIANGEKRTSSTITLMRDNSRLAYLLAKSLEKSRLEGFQIWLD